MSQSAIRTNRPARASSTEHRADTKLRLALLVQQKLLARNLGQADAAELLGLKQPKVSALVNGKLTGFSMEKLMELLNKLGEDVEIKVRKAPRAAEGKIHVTAA
ncbi:MAG: helix-turn-helix transcriptional regulator [Candidatus Korobacteraceae bacterium]|jgi:predicted XRE-type DNA-binding protein